MVDANSISRPDIVGRLDPLLFTHLQDQFPAKDNEFFWRPEGDNRANAVLLELLRPMHDIVISHEARLGGLGIATIHYNVDTQTVPSQDSQRGEGWHVDGGGAAAYVAANVMPTEFMVGDPDLEAAAEIIDRIEESAGSDEGVKIDTEELSKSDITVFQPEPFEVVMFNSHIHRSPLNRSDTTVARTWIRADVFRNF